MRRRTRKPGKNWRVKERTKETNEIEELERRIAEQVPPKGTNPLAEDAITDEYSVFYPEAKSFDEFPISKNTLKGLHEQGFLELTPIQRATLPHSLAGRDILGAAKTGSGKTLAFVIPAVELLYKQRWTEVAGLSALIVSPVRELALQTFEVFRRTARYHSIGAGAIVGGVGMRTEAQALPYAGVLVATPGRLLHHLDNCPSFDANNLRMLVFDEADRILDLGFAKEVDAIISHLPPTRQILLFSATQTRAVADLARLSLKDPEYISVDELAVYRTPEPSALVQRAIVVELHQKLDCLFSFIKTHTGSKTLAFFSTCKQVRFIFETFRRLRPGVVLLHLHGKMSQIRRSRVYDEFCKRRSVVLFATDIAARGLDFPEVDWIVQVDCPDGVSTYIHRVGRTARFTSKGQGLLMLLPSETKFLGMLTSSRVPVEEAQINMSRQVSITHKLQGFVAADVTVKNLAQGAFRSYIRSVFFQNLKEVFDIKALPIGEFAQSLGLHNSPRLRILQTSSEGSAVLAEKKDFCSGNSQPAKRRKVAIMTDEDRASEEEEEEDEEDDGDLLERAPPRENELEQPTEAATAYPEYRHSAAWRTKKARHSLNVKFLGKRVVLDNDDDNAGNTNQQGDATIRGFQFPCDGKNVSQLLTPVRQDSADSYVEKMKNELMQEDPVDKINLQQRLRERRHRMRSKLKKTVVPTRTVQELGT